MPILILRTQTNNALHRSISVLLVLAACIIAPISGRAQPVPGYTIATIAGNGSHDFGGDDGAAVDAALNYPQGIAFDTDGNLYIADCFNHRIRRVAADGTIRTVAGTSTSGYSGDGNAATGASLLDPCGIAVDALGNLYIADTGNNAIRRVGTNGVITTIAGNGTEGFSGDDSAATSANLNVPLGLDRDAAGNLYFADTANNRIRKVTADGTISTVAGNGLAGNLGDGGAARDAELNGPQDVAFDASGNLYIADTFNQRIRKVAADGTISTVAGTSTRGFAGDGGPAVEAQLNYPKALAVDSNGNIFIADTFNSRIRVVTPAGVIATIAGNGRLGARGDGGPATSAELRFPSGLAVDGSGRVYVSDDQNSRIRALTPGPETTNPDALPTILPSGVVSSAQFGAFPSIAPGSWIEIHGRNLASSARSWSASDFVDGRAPTSLDGTTVTIGGQAAYLASVSPSQVIAQVPMNIGLGRQRVTVATLAGMTDPYEIEVEPTQPGLLAPAEFRIGGRQYVAATLADGATRILPEGAMPGVPTRPVRPGEVIVLLGIGFGGVTPFVDAGETGGRLSSLDLSIKVFFSDRQAALSYAGLAPGAVGVYQFNVIVPEIHGGDAVPLSFTLGGISGQQTLYTAVEE